MISHCANPDCATPFHYLRGGRLYRFEVKSPSSPRSDVPTAIYSHKAPLVTVYFWLCKSCCSRLSLRFDPTTGVRLQSLPASAESISQVPVIVETESKPDAA